MKRSFLAIALIAALSGLSAHAELLYETFDSHSPGTLMQNVPGWSTLEGLSAANGIVSTQRVMSTLNALELPKPPGSPFATKTTAAYTNFSYAYRGTNGFILRAAALLFRTNNKSLITMELGKGTDTIIQVAFRTNGQIVVGTHTTAVLSVTGRYAEVDLYYDMSNNLAALDYNATNVMPWRNIGTPVSTQFNMVAFKRLSSAAGTEGTVLIDNVAVEVIPLATMGWWRFERDDPPLFDDRAETVEHTGRFRPYDSSNNNEPGSWDRLWTGADAVQNRHAYRQPGFKFNQTRDVTVPLGNWTLEFILKIAPGSDSFCLFDWEAGSVTTNCLISALWNLSNSNLTCNLREDERSDTHASYYTDLGPVPADGQWHHAAIRKFQSTLTGYVDYDLQSSTPLSAYSDGSYAFRTNTHIACLGVALNSASPAGSGVYFDEVRFSSAALNEDQFLQIPAAEFSGLPADTAAATWTFDIQTRPLIHYYLERTPNPAASPPVWTAVANWWASNFVSSVDFPRPTQTAAIFRVRN